MAREPSKSVETITSNEGLVRMKIYDGDLELGDAGAELVRLANAQRDAALDREASTAAALWRAKDAIARLVREIADE